MKMREILFAMGDLLLPRTCVVCGSMLTLAERESGAEMCLDCFLNLPRTHIHRLPTLSAGRNAVQERLGDGPPLLIGGAWFYYGRDSAYASLIRSAKYNDRPALAHTGESFWRIFPTLGAILTCSFRCPCTGANRCAGATTKASG